MVDLEKEVNETNHKVAEISGLPPEIHAFQRKYNPMAFYARLKIVGSLMGMSEGLIKQRAKGYQMLYDQIMGNIKYYWERKKK